MALYTKEELAYERSIGLSLSDYENENFYNPSPTEQVLNWTKDQFEDYLATKGWSEEIKNNHRYQFKGTIIFDNGTISYE